MYAFQSISVSGIAVVSTILAALPEKTFNGRARRASEACSQGIFQMIRAHRTASATNNSGDSHRVCFGFMARSMPFLYRSIESFPRGRTKLFDSFASLLSIVSARRLWRPFRVPFPGASLSASSVMVYRILFCKFLLLPLHYH